MANLDIAKLKSIEPAVVCVGSHPGIIQSMMDFDFLQGRQKPSIIAVVASGRRSERYFYGKQEVLVPVYESPEALPSDLRDRANFFLSLVSGRRVLSSTKYLLNTLPG